MSFKVVATDLDGTLLRSDGTLSERTRQALQAVGALGVEVLALTARPPRRVRAIADRCGMNALVICSNGSVFYDIASDRIVHEQRLSAENSYALIVRLRAAIPGVVFAVEAGTQYGCEPTYAILKEHADDRVDPLMERDDALVLSRAGVTKLIIQHPDRDLEELHRLTITHVGQVATVTHSGSRFVEVAAAGVTKALALERFCKERELTASQVIAFGDMPNDLPMLSWAGHSVAVQNAHPSVLAAVHEVTMSNDADGVALVLERLLADASAGGRLPATVS